MHIKCTRSLITSASYGQSLFGAPSFEISCEPSAPKDAFGVRVKGGAGGIEINKDEPPIGNVPCDLANSHFCVLPGCLKWVNVLLAGRTMELSVIRSDLGIAPKCSRYIVKEEERVHCWGQVGSATYYAFYKDGSSLSADLTKI